MSTRRSVVAAIASIATGVVAMGATASNPVSHWKANGTLTDSVGSNDAVAIGAVGYQRTECDMGFLFEAGSHLSVPGPIAGGLGSTASFSVTATFRELVFGNNASIVNLRTPNNNSGFTVEPAFATPGSILFAVYVGGGFQLLVANGFTVGATHHLAAVFDGVAGVMTVYRNGAVAGSIQTPPNSPMVLQGSEILLIARNVVTSNPLNAMIDEVRYFDYPLTQAEVAALLPCGGSLLGDLNDDGFVDGADLGILLGAWGGPAADLNGDGITDGSDLGILLGEWTG